MKSYIDIANLLEDRNDTRENTKSGERDKEKEEASPFDKLHENALNALDRIVKRGKKLEEENRHLAARCVKQGEQVETLREDGRSNAHARGIQCIPTGRDAVQGRTDARLALPMRHIFLQRLG